MNIEEVKNLIELFENSSLSELKYRTDKDEIKLKKPTNNEVNGHCEGNSCATRSAMP